jgi:hypothetical protein
VSDSLLEETGKCSLCGGTYVMGGNNPAPLLPFHYRCCKSCDENKVIPERLRQYLLAQAAKKGGAS